MVILALGDLFAAVATRHHRVNRARILESKVP